MLLKYYNALLLLHYWTSLLITALLLVVNQVAGAVHSILRILNSRLGSQGNIRDSKDVIFVTE